MTTTVYVRVAKQESIVPLLEYFSVVGTTNPLLTRFAQDYRNVNRVDLRNRWLRLADEHLLIMIPEEAITMNRAQFPVLKVNFPDANLFGHTTILSPENTELDIISKAMPKYRQSVPLLSTIVAKNSMKVFLEQVLSAQYPGESIRPAYAYGRGWDAVRYANIPAA